MSNIYDLARAWFNFCFENPEKINPNHSAMFFFAIEHNNRLAWKEKFGLPSTMVMEAIGIKSYNTYIKTFNDLVGWGFIILVQKSKNQYSSNIVALSIGISKNNKALDKATIKHVTKQSESTEQSKDSIDIQDYNNTNLPVVPPLNFPEFQKLYSELILKFNTAFNKQQSNGNPTTKAKLHEVMLSGFTIDQIITACSNALKDKWIIDENCFRLDYLLTIPNIDKYLNSETKVEFQNDFHPYIDPENPDGTRKLIPANFNIHIKTS
jgi:hypothetical protein